MDAALPEPTDMTSTIAGIVGISLVIVISIAIIITISIIGRRISMMPEVTELDPSQPD